MKDRLANQLPEVLDKVNDAADRISNPNSIWLESIQYADYMEQLGTHLVSHEPTQECVFEVADQIILMSRTFKMMGESALTALDEVEDFTDAQQ